MNIKELEKLEAASNSARIIYDATALDDPDIDKVYLAYKDAYNALSYARFFNTEKAKPLLDNHPGFMSLAGRGIGKSALRKHMANKLKLTQGECA